MQQFSIMLLRTATVSRSANTFHRPRKDTLIGKSSPHTHTHHDQTTCHARRNCSRVGLGFEHVCYPMEHTQGCLPNHLPAARGKTSETQYVCVATATAGCLLYRALDHAMQTECHIPVEVFDPCSKSKPVEMCQSGKSTPLAFVVTPRLQHTLRCIAEENITNMAAIPRFFCCIRTAREHLENQAPSQANSLTSIHIEIWKYPTPMLPPHNISRQKTARP